MLLKSDTQLKIVAFVILITIFHPANALQIKRLSTDVGTVLRLRGAVKEGDFVRLKSVLGKGAIAGLDIRSGGGSLEDGLEIARVVRDKGLVVYASRECDSVCAFIFFAAKERYLGRRCKIGVHSVSNERGREDAETARSTVLTSRLLAGLGVPHSIIGKIVTTPPAKVTFLNNSELAGLNVRRINPFRNHDGLLSSAKSQEASSIYELSLDAETEGTSDSRTGALHDTVSQVGEQ